MLGVTWCQWSFNESLSGCQQHVYLLVSILSFTNHMTSGEFFNHSDPLLKITSKTLGFKFHLP